MLKDRAVRGEAGILLVGIDPSLGALKKARTRLIKMRAELGERIAARVLLFNTDMAAAAEFVGRASLTVDAATMVEVIEHLDPVPLARIGNDVFSCFQPTCYVVTTPNIEFNPSLMRLNQAHAKTAPPTAPRPAPSNLPQITPWRMALGDSNSESADMDVDHEETAEEEVLVSAEAGSSARGLPLRNSDHRFEWTRKEFAEWAYSEAKKATKYLGEVGVSFGGCGKLPQITEPADGSSAIVETPIREDVGFCTQLVAFERQQNASNQGDKPQIDRFTLPGFFESVDF
mmetsp:Transcript_9805/g.24652  ORF Transcript_9805/g.24652 Transcript_9805/m.24652 type:complete len:287 (-) Transcript_9805:659-1519(-)